MVISIVGSVLCSCKALYDASVRLAQAQGLLDKAKQLEVVVSVDMKYEGRSGGGWPTSCLIEANGIEHEFAFHPGSGVNRGQRESTRVVLGCFPPKCSFRNMLYIPQTYPPEMLTFTDSRQATPTAEPAS